MLAFLAQVEPGPITDVLKGILVYGLWAEILGVAVAWLKVRKLEAWANRAKEDGSVRLLSTYVAQVTLLVVLWGALVTACAVIGSRL
jgi:hypothetical protein